MSNFKVGDTVRRLPKYRDAGAWNRGDAVMTVVGHDVGGAGCCWTVTSTASGWRRCHPRRFEKVAAPTLARDELYMRLRNDAGLSHQHATEFLAACPGYASIRHALDARGATGEVMGCLVVWYGKNEGVYREAARRCGWGS